MPESSPDSASRRKLLAWGVHLLTASGAVLGLLATLAIFQDQWMQAIAWMVIAVVVDGMDGTLARLWQVRQTLPQFDGALLDNMIDYVNYVLVPALFLHEANLVPHSLALAGASSVLLASSYQFCQADAKTPDHFFLGFPSYWNVVVFYLFILGLSRWLNLIVIVVFCLLVFVPIKYVYPSRTSRYRRATLILTALWFVSGLVVFFQYPTPQRWLVWISLVYPVYYLGISLYLTLHPSRRR
jgi:phosphatidylcholine synthase